MLTCREVAERSEDWLNQDLSRWQSLQMRLHLAMCKGCDRFISQMRVTRDLTQAAALVDSGHDADDSRIGAILSALRDGKKTTG
ncbi:MAG: zf-HC2 domain-containing protein [Pseudorhodobacter sp.]|nr:zf-HC2 domain-containing protein [Pseudorhodobacter sp.]